MNDELNMSSADIDRAEAEYSIKRADAFERLRKNEDFQFLIENEYLQKNAARVVKLRGEGEIHPGFQDNLLKEIDGMAYLATWLRTIHNQGLQAKNLLEDIEEETLRMNEGE